LEDEKAQRRLRLDRPLAHAALQQRALPEEIAGRHLHHDTVLALIPNQHGGLAGGHDEELIAPLACFSYFFVKRETAGAAFCAFWFFENFLYIGTYMADARTLSLPLVGSGDHDWEILFTHWNILVHDQQIGHATQALGWLGMLATVAWFSLRSLYSRQSM